MARLWFAGVLGLLACEGTVNRAAGPPAPTALPEPPEWKAETRLDGLLPAGAVPIGVAVDPSGRRHVLDRRSGLYRLTGATAELVVSTTDLAAVAGLGLGLELTDVAAYGPDRLAFTAENEGFVFDLRSRNLWSRFCYFPTTSDSPPAPVDAIPSVSQRLRSQGIAVKERTEAVAYSAETGLLIAQPRTIRLDTGAIAGAELFMFRLPGEQPFQTRTISEPAFLAGGMVTVGRRLLLGTGNKIFDMTGSDQPLLVRGFRAPVEITGMALDLDGQLLVLDGAGRRLLKITVP